MKKTAFLRCLVFALSLGIVAMSFIGCEGAEGPIGSVGPAGYTGAVPLFLQGTWTTPGASYLFTADALIITRIAPPEGSGTAGFLTFSTAENGDAGTSGTYPGGYKISYIYTSGSGTWGATLPTGVQAVELYFNSTSDMFIDSVGTIFTKE